MENFISGFLVGVCFMTLAILAYQVLEAMAQDRKIRKEIASDEQ